MDGFAHLVDAAQWLADAVTRPPFALAATLVVVGLLVLGGVHKIRHPLSAAASAVRFGVVRHASRRAGYALGLAELGAASLMLAWPRAAVITGTAIALLLTIGFVVVISAALARGEHFPCNCLSDDEDEISKTTLVRAIGMTVAVGIGAAGAIRSSTPLYWDVENGLAGIGIAALVVGAFLIASASSRLWQSHRDFARTIDWDWVTSLHRSHNPNLGR